MGFKNALASFLDATRFQPFRVFSGYYVAYSTWLGAIFPLGCIVLLVLYGGSSFLAWARVPNSEDTRVAALAAALTLRAPLLGFSFFLSSDTDGVDSSSTFTLHDTTTSELVEVTAEHCSGAWSSAGDVAHGGLTFEGLDETVTCSNVTLVDEAANEFCTGSALCLDNSGAGLTLQGARSIAAAGQTRQFVRLTARLLNPGSDDDLARLAGARMSLFVANEMPAALISIDERPELAYNVSYLVPVEPELLYTPSVLLEARTVRALPSYFGDEEVFSFAQVSGLEGRYGDRDNASVDARPVVLQVTYELRPAHTTTRMVPATLLFMIARFGQLIAALALCNFLIYRINFMTFYHVADDTFYVPDITVRNFLMANKKLRVKEFENMLIFAFSFGGVERFGLQTRHLHEFFNDKEHRYDRARAHAVVEDVQRFTAEKRIGNFVNEERKVDRLGDDSDYDIAAASAGGAFAQASALVGDPEDDGIDDGTEDGRNRGVAVIREAETTLKLCVLHDELSKMKSIAATLFPTQAKRYRLAERLHGRHGVPPS